MTSDREVAARLAAAGLPSFGEVLGTGAGQALGCDTTKRAVRDILDNCFRSPPAQPRELLMKKLSQLEAFKRVCDATTSSCAYSLPQAVTLTAGEQHKDFQRCRRLDAEGRPVYQSSCGGDEQFIAFHRTPGPSGPGGSAHGVWAACATRDGRPPVAWQLDGYDVPHGSGRAPDGVIATGVACEPADAALPMHSCRTVEALVAWIKEGGFGDGRPGLLAVARDFAAAWAALAHAVDAAVDAPSESAGWPEVIGVLEAVAAADLGPQIKKEIPFFLDYVFDLSTVACFSASTRTLDVSDPAPSCAPLLHAMVVQRTWQAQVKQIDVAAPGRAATQSFHVVSDTHEWDGLLGLPGGDVLLHCGDIMVDSWGFTGEAEPPRLAKAFGDLEHLAQRYKRVFFVGGNHDRALHELWARDHAGLCARLPKNVLMLHCAPDSLDPKLKETFATQDRLVADAVADGAVRLLPDLSLCSPAERTGEGWVIVGCGCSQSSYNTAFQFAKDDEEARRSAYAALVRHQPDIVLTHGQPWKDDLLKEAVCGCASVRVHAFGHDHGGYGVTHDSGKAFINAAICGDGLPPFGLLPLNPPVMFHL